MNPFWGVIMIKKMAAKTNLIINADDLGMSAEVNAQIEECIKLGVVTSSTLMANAPSFDEGVRIAKQYPQVSVGVHLNIIEFAPLTNGNVFKKHGIVGEDGNFIEGAIFCLHIDDELRQAIFEEWDAQISKIEAAGIIPAHCDSHQHTHTISSLREPLFRVLNKHGIGRVRRKMIPSIRLMLRQRHRPAVKLDKSKAMVPQKRSLIYRRFHLFSVIRACRRWNNLLGEQFNITDSFFSFNDFYYDGKVLCLGKKNAVVELMCHPGHKAFQNETDNLLDKQSWYNPEKYKIISYKEL